MKQRISKFQANYQIIEPISRKHQSIPSSRKHESIPSSRKHESIAFSYIPFFRTNLYRIGQAFCQQILHLKEIQNLGRIDVERSIKSTYFCLQIKILEKLSHPNLIKLHEVIIEEHFVYVIEQYCEEGDLQHHLKRSRKKNTIFDESLVAKWCLQLLLAVQYLHFQNIIHSNIKPTNIFLTSTGNLKLGSSQPYKHMVNQLHTTTPTPYYASPELIANHTYDQKIDIWALGCVLYEICTFQSVFACSNMVQFVIKITKQKPQELPHCYSKSLQKIYQKCLKKKPEERLSAKELLKTPYFIEAIHQFLKNENLPNKVSCKIPIKKYKVHKKNIEKNPIKEFVLPKIDIQSQKVERKQILYRQSKSREKSREHVKTPTFSSKQKHTQGLSSEKRKGNSCSKKIQSNQKQFSPKIQFFEKKTILNQPPILPKPIKKSIVNQENKVLNKVDSTQKEIVEGLSQSNFEMTLSKQALGKQLKDFQKFKEQNILDNSISRMNESLSKMFQQLKIREQQQIQFQLEQQQISSHHNKQIRLTTQRREQEDSNDLMKTYTCKLEQLIQEINYKYCPDMEPIAERTREFGTNQFGTNQFAKEMFKPKDHFL